MKRWVPLIPLAVLLIGGAAYWMSRPSPAPRQASPEPTPQPRSGRSVYHFTPPGAEPAQPEPEEDWPEGASPSVPPDIIAAFSLASNDATGLMWEECVRPWRGEEEVDDSPLTVNLVLVDGRVSDVEIISPIALPAELIQCMKDRVWSVDFPEHDLHRGELRLQRTLSLNR